MQNIILKLQNYLFHFSKRKYEHLAFAQQEEKKWFAVRSSKSPPSWCDLNSEKCKTILIKKHLVVETKNSPQWNKPQNQK